MERALEIPSKSTTIDAFYSREVPAAQVSHGDAAGGFRIHPHPSRDANPREQEQSGVWQEFLGQQPPNYPMDTSAHSSSPRQSHLSPW